MSLWELGCYAVVSFGTAILSGIAGGGAGFINAPLLILFGLSPAQAIATGKLTGLSVAASSLGGLRKITLRQSKRQLAIIIGLAIVVGLLAPQVITRLDSTLYRRVLGVIMLIMIPVLLLKKPGHKTTQPNMPRQVVGYALLLPALLLQGVFGAGMGTLVNVVLMLCMGMSALESSVAKRYSQVVLNVVIVLGVLMSHLIVWPAALVGIVSSGVGGYLGTHLAVRHGNTLVLRALMVLALTSAIFLLVS